MDFADFFFLPTHFVKFLVFYHILEIIITGIELLSYGTVLVLGQLKFNKKNTVRYR